VKKLKPEKIEGSFKPVTPVMNALFHCCPLRPSLFRGLIGSVPCASLSALTVATSYARRSRWR
jgi:hypothetical protein